MFFHLSEEEIIKQYAPIVKKQLKQLNIFKDYEDYYQAGLIALWEAYTRFDPDKGSFPSFAIMTVRGRLLTLLHKEKGFSEKHYISEEGFHQIIDENNEIPLEMELLSAYLEGLTPNQQLWIKEAIINQKTSAEIAEEYEIHPHSVRSWKKGVIKRLKERYKY